MWKGKKHRLIDAMCKDIYYIVLVIDLNGDARRNIGFKGDVEIEDF